MSHDSHTTPTEHAAGRAPPLHPLGQQAHGEDTVKDPATGDVAPFTEAQFNELAKATGVVVVHCLGIAQCLQNGTTVRTHYHRSLMAVT